MKKRNLFITGLLLCAVSFSGCDKKNNDVKNTLSVSGAVNSAIVFDAEDNDDVILTVTTNAAEWDYTAPNWVIASKNGNTLTVNVADNTGNEREGTIEFTAGTADAFVITVTQSKPEDIGGGDEINITIDGAFADWAEYPVTKTGHDGMQETKYYSDGTDLFLYFKANASVLKMSWDNLMIYFDSDNNNTTGTPMAYAFGGDSGAGGMDFALELNVASEYGLQNPIGKWSGDPYIDIRTGWDGMTGVDDIKGATNITNCINGIGAIDGDYYELEVRVIVEKLPWTLASPFRMAARFGNDFDYAPVYEWDWASE